MQDGMSKTRKGDREIISVSLPLAVYDALQKVCDHYNINRSSMIASAIVDYIRIAFDVRVGEK